jgi:hypothetical protein
MIAFKYLLKSPRQRQRQRHHLGVAIQNTDFIGQIPYCTKPIAMFTLGLRVLGFRV